MGDRAGDITNRDDLWTVLCFLLPDYVKRDAIKPRIGAQGAAHIELADITAATAAGIFGREALGHFVDQRLHAFHIAPGDLIQSLVGQIDIAELFCGPCPEHIKATLDMFSGAGEAFASKINKTCCLGVAFFGMRLQGLKQFFL